MPTLWRDRNFLKLWAGQTISEIGSRISREGIPLTAVMTLGATTMQMGFLSAIGGVTALIAGPLAGIAADRYRRKPLMIVADIGRALALSMIPLAAAYGRLSLPLLFAVVTVTGILTVFFDVSYQTMVPSLVPGERLLEANSKLALTTSTAEVIGPAMTGVLVQLLTAPRAILLDAVSFLLSAGSIAAIHKREDPPHREAGAAAFRDLIAGLPFAASHPILRPVALRAATASFFGGFFMTLYVLFAIRDLRIAPSVLGVVIALGGISNFFGAILAGHIRKWLPLGPILIGATVLSGSVLLLIPLARDPWSGAIVLGLSQLLGDLAFPVYNIHELTLRQKVTPAHLLGRVNAFLHMLMKGLWPIGAVAGGALASHIGSRATSTISGAGIMLSSLWLVFSEVRRLR